MNIQRVLRAVFLAFAVTSGLSKAENASIPAPTPYAITMQDGNSRDWQSTSYETAPDGTRIPKVHSYTELATGLNHLVNGQWVESKEEVDILPDGTAAAINGQHQAYFPGDIYNGVIELVTPDGQHLRSRPLCLSYFDGTNSVLIAELTNSIGYLVGSNQVIYPDAFEGVKADLRYTYTKAGFEQDVILRESPLTPESYGLNPGTARLEVLTEFFDPPPPAVNAGRVSTGAGTLENDSLDFGVMQMGCGKAFLLGTHSPSTLVNKQWLALDGRQFLVEEVPVNAIVNELLQLPGSHSAGQQPMSVGQVSARAGLDSAMNRSGSSGTVAQNSMLNVVCAKRVLPARHLATKSLAGHWRQMARITTAAHGLVLDYIAVISQTNFTFHGNATYYISGGVQLSGTNTFEAGTVLKYTNGASLLLLSTNLNWQGSVYLPVILTAKDDDSVGEAINGSTGSPTNYYALTALVFDNSSLTIANLRVAYAQQGLVYAGGATPALYNAQFLNCQVGINVAGVSLKLRNAVLGNVWTNDLIINSGSAIDAQNVTFSGGGCLVNGPFSPSGASLVLTNCILANMNSLTNGVLTLSANTNGFYRSPPYGTGQVTNTFYPFKTYGNDNYYLTNGVSFVNAGTTNLDAALLAGLRGMTTYTPPDGGFADTNLPDLGYHYPLAGNSSTGTDFWLAFFNMPVYNGLSLYISSPVAVTGTVYAPGCLTNGPIIIVTNVTNGDTAVNGTYVLTNRPVDLEDYDGGLWGDDAFNSTYVMGSYLIVDDYGMWYLLDADSKSALYSTFITVDGATWDDANATNSPPTTLCPQIAFNQPFSVAAGGITNMALPPQAMMTINDSIGTNGIHVVASQPVSVYAVNYYPASSAAFTAYPTSMLGTNYCVMSRASVDNQFSDLPNYSQLAVVATVDNTTVTIIPSPTAGLAGHSGMFQTNLNQGETYQINSSDSSHDVTGTTVSSDKLISVFAGANIAFVPDANTAAGNPLVQEQLPVEQWGTNVVSLSFAGRTNGDTYRILAAYSNTVVTITGKIVTITNESINLHGPWLVTATNETVTTTITNAGQFYELIVDGPVQFQATKPIQVAQFANGVYFDTPPNFYGDPCEILLPPIGHYLPTNIVVTLPNDNISGDFAENYLNLIVSQSATNSTFLDSSLVAATNFMTIGTSGYYGAQITVTNSGSHKITSFQPVGVEVYGFGVDDAYGYFGGNTK
jgi:IgGFc binding protein